MDYTNNNTKCLRLTIWLSMPIFKMNNIL